MVLSCGLIAFPLFAGNSVVYGFLEPKSVISPFRPPIDGLLSTSKLRFKGKMSNVGAKSTKIGESYQKDHFSISRM